MNKEDAAKCLDYLDKIHDYLDEYDEEIGLPSDVDWAFNEMWAFFSWEARFCCALCHCNRAKYCENCDSGDI